MNAIKERTRITPHSVPKILIIVLIEASIALIHSFRLGQLFNGQAYILYYSYASDFMLPFGWYFLLSITDATIPFLRKWYVKAGIIFSIMSLSEICQFFGIELFGVTFDPMDICMYGAGVLIAAFVDVKVFGRLFGFWGTAEKEEEH